jgi:putative ABC transport system permease protein
MILNILRLALRNLARRKTLSLINIGGLAISLASCIFIFYFVYDEFSYDRFHEKASRIYRLTIVFQTPEGKQNLLWTHQKIGPYIKRVYPQVEDAVRIEDVEAVFGKTNKETKGIVKADPSIFNVFSYPLIEGNRPPFLKTSLLIISITVWLITSAMAFNIPDTVDVCNDIVGHFDHQDLAGHLSQIPAD